MNNKNCNILLEKVFESKKSQGEAAHIEILNNTEEYKDQCGVWALIDEETGQVLEVAQKDNIYIELHRTSVLLIKDYSKEKNRKFVRKSRILLLFNISFDILECDKDRTVAKYRNIAEKYNHLAIYVIKNAESKSKNEREEIEMMYAVDNQALYWNAWGKQRHMAREYYKANYTDNKNVQC
jgi:hypothetical protein